MYVVQLARPNEDTDRLVKTIAICAGSGGSMFQDVEADLYFTGEMQHVGSALLRAYPRVDLRFLARYSCCYGDEPFRPSLCVWFSLTLKVPTPI